MSRVWQRAVAGAHKSYQFTGIPRDLEQNAKSQNQDLSSKASMLWGLDIGFCSAIRIATWVDRT